MRIREHIRRAFGYSIRIALVSVVAIPVWLCLWWFSGPHPTPRDFPFGVLPHVIGIPAIVFLSPAYFLIRLAYAARISGGIMLDWLVGLIFVWVFWGTILYCVVQFYRYMRHSPSRV